MGTIIADHYKVTSVLGSGGMGVVLAAKDQALNRNVAIKLLQKQDEKALARFQTEARAIGSLDHPNIVRVHQMGLHRYQPFLVMDVLDGQTLAKLIKITGGLTLPQALPIFSQLCDALEHAHSKGIIHRDLKATNVMLTKAADGADRVQLLDFGIAKIIEETEEAQIQQTNTNEIIGTPAYMSPEQIEKQTLDWRCDIYGLGCLIFESLSGKPPFKGGSYFETLRMHISSPPPSLAERSKIEAAHLAAIDAVILRCMAKNVKDRYQSAAEVKEALQAILKEKPLTPVQSLLQRLKNIGLRSRAANQARPVWAIAALAGTLLISTACGAFYFGALKEPAEKRWKTLWIDGQNQFNQGQFRQAKSTYSEALMLAQSSLPLQKYIAPSVSELVDISAAIGDWQSYQKYKKTQDEIYLSQKRDELRLVQEMQTLLATGKPKAEEAISLATRANDQASIFLASGKAPEARPLLDRALSLTALSLPLSADVFARTMHNLALTCNNLGQNDEAEKLYLKSIQFLQENKLGKLSADIGKDYIGIGRLRFQQKRFDEANQYFRDAIKLYTATFGPQSEQVAWVKVNIAESLMAEGKNDLALEQIKQARALFDTLEHPDEQKRARCYALQAFITGKSEDLASALTLQQESLRREPYYLSSLLLKSGPGLNTSSKDSDAPLGFTVRSFVIATGSEPPVTSVASDAARTLEVVCMRRNDLPQLEHIYRYKLLTDQRNRSGDKGLIAQDMLALGQYFMRVQNSQLAEEFLLQAKSLIVANGEAGKDWLAADAYGSLGQFYLDQKDESKADMYLKKMTELTANVSTHEPPPAPLSGAYLRYCAHLDTQGKIQEAKSLRELWAKATANQVLH